MQALQELSQQHAAELEGRAWQASQAAVDQEGCMRTLLAEAQQQAQADSRCAAPSQAVPCRPGSYLSALLAREQVQST